MKLELSMSDLPSPSGLFEDGILTTSDHHASELANQFIGTCYTINVIVLRNCLGAVNLENVQISSCCRIVNASSELKRKVSL